MGKLGKKQLTLHLQEPMREIPAGLEAWALELNGEGTELRLSFRAGEEQSCIPALLRRIGDLGIEFRDLNTRQSSLEEIFVDLVRER
jgi:ABC-2 type transport system ATP-binding protein